MASRHHLRHWVAGICLTAALASGCSSSSGTTAPATSAAQANVVSNEGLTNLLIHFEVDGQPAAPFVNLQTQEIYFSFEGNMYAPTIDAQTGLVTGHGDAIIGHFGPAYVAFKVNAAKLPTDSDFLTFRCIKCQISFVGGANDGALLKSLLPGNDPVFPDPITAGEPLRSLAFNIPMQGRFLQNLGPVQPDGTLALGIGLRGAGCGGSQEVAGKGLIAGKRGTICMNGQFDFATPEPARLLTLLSGFSGSATADQVTALLNFLASSSFHGQSNCPLAFHTQTPAAS